MKKLCAIKLRALRRIAANERGAAAVEFAFIMPVALAMMVAAIDMGLFFLNRHRMADAAHSAAHVLATRPMIVTADTTGTTYAWNQGTGTWEIYDRSGGGITWAPASCTEEGGNGLGNNDNPPTRNGIPDPSKPYKPDKIAVDLSGDPLPNGQTLITVACDHQIIGNGATQKAQSARAFAEACRVAMEKAPDFVKNCTQISVRYTDSWAGGRIYHSQYKGVITPAVSVRVQSTKGSFLVMPIASRIFAAVPNGQTAMAWADEYKMPSYTTTRIGAAAIYNMGLINNPLCGAPEDLFGSGDECPMN